MQRDINGSDSGSAARHAGYAVTALKQMSRVDAIERVSTMSHTELKSVVLSMLEKPAHENAQANNNLAMNALLAFREVYELEFYLGSQQAMLEASDGTFSEEELSDCKEQIRQTEEDLLEKEVEAQSFLTGDSLYPMSRDELIAKYSPHLRPTKP